MVAEAHNDLRRHQDHSPLEAMHGRTPAPIDADLLANANRALTGSWRGPGIALFHQKQLDQNDGSISPTGVAWMISGGRLLRIAPQHLKVASEADRLLFEMANGPARNLSDSLNHIYPARRRTSLGRRTRSPSRRTRRARQFPGIQD